MEVEIHVSEEELAEFPEEATDSTREQSQSGKTSQTPDQGTVQSLLLVRATPTLSLLRKIRKGYARYVIRDLLNLQEDQDQSVSISDHIP